MDQLFRGSERLCITMIPETVENTLGAEFLSVSRSKQARHIP